MMIKNSNLNEKYHQWLKTLCLDIKERTTGSQRNRNATGFFKDQLDSLGRATESHEFKTMDKLDGGATLHATNNEFKVLVSSWSNGSSVQALMEGAFSMSELLIKLITILYTNESSMTIFSIFSQKYYENIVMVRSIRPIN